MRGYLLFVFVKGLAPLGVIIGSSAVESLILFGFTDYCSLFTDYCSLKNPPSPDRQHFLG
ncbi:MAG: hypothetical protein EWV76_15100 [Microcystis novacekii Mn_MB_F_20050700_S1]|uniref:Uncharacterized protein n=1 Tax=Microcystis novacekii Mn_MB_F_20050700_S1D TaxID=2486266 RepID=A0A552J038_9CHRO|nr:MAG: hypothetical protein EWV76_15100 [Microcystis novacekii Mn_MB_F_20050700_S1]TRU89024.1 MAG: hypothetical protein EWV54_09135 [Microcystis novacekii Mn_MB_F_20050700_S1D]